MGNIALVFVTSGFSLTLMKVCMSVFTGGLCYVGVTVTLTRQGAVVEGLTRGQWGRGVQGMVLGTPCFRQCAF